MLLIKNGTIVNPAKHQHEVTNILVEDGKIKEIGQNVSVAGKEEACHRQCGGFA